MTAQHTQARVMAGTMPVSINNQLSQFHAVGIEDTTTAVALTGVVGDDRDALSVSDARRLAACWNFCDGLDTDGMEISVDMDRPAKVVLDEFIKKELDLVFQRDQLLVALQTIMAGVAGCQREPQWEAARAAIAACQPQPKVQHLPADDTEGGAA